MVRQKSVVKRRSSTRRCSKRRSKTRRSKHVSTKRVVRSKPLRRKSKGGSCQELFETKDKLKRDSKWGIKERMKYSLCKRLSRQKYKAYKRSKLMSSVQAFERDDDEDRLRLKLKAEATKQLESTTRDEQARNELFTRSAKKPTEQRPTQVDQKPSTDQKPRKSNWRLATMGALNHVASLLLHKKNDALRQDLREQARDIKDSFVDGKERAAELERLREELDQRKVQDRQKASVTKTFGEVGINTDVAARGVAEPEVPSKPKPLLENIVGRMQNNVLRNSLNGLQQQVGQLYQNITASNSDNNRLQQEISQRDSDLAAACKEQIDELNQQSVIAYTTIKNTRREVMDLGPANREVQSKLLSMLIHAETKLDTLRTVRWKGTDPCVWMREHGQKFASVLQLADGQLKLVLKELNRPPADHRQTVRHEPMLSSSLRTGSRNSWTPA